MRSPAVARVSDPWLDPLSGNVGRDGEIVRPIFYRQCAPSPADGQPDDHADPDQDQSNRTLHPKISLEIQRIRDIYLDYFLKATSRDW